MCGGSSIYQNMNLSENRLPKINWSIIIFPVNCNLRVYTFVLGPVSQGWGFPVVTEAAIQQDVRPIALIHPCAVRVWFASQELCPFGHVSPFSRAPQLSRGFRRRNGWATGISAQNQRVGNPLGMGIQVGRAFPLCFRKARLSLKRSLWHLGITWVCLIMGYGVKLPCYRAKLG